MTDNGGSDNRTRVPVLGFSIDSMPMDGAVNQVLDWAKLRASRYVCFCNAHMVVTAKTDDPFAQVLSQADLVLPDGMPIAVSMRRKGALSQQRVAGPDFMLHCCARAARENIPVYFYGSTEETLRLLTERLPRDYSGLRIAGAYSPPFRPQTEQEGAAAIAAINDSGAGIIFVGLGCPKQELWMARNSQSIHGVLLGVGAAFDFAAGNLTRAPLWMRQNGLEWLYRLLKEPRRLWKRNLVTNSLFLYYSLREVLK